MKSGLTIACILFICGGLFCQHLSLNLGLHESPFNPRGNFPSINGGIDYEQTIFPWLSVSTGAIYSLSIMGPDDSDYCSPPTWLERCPKSLSGSLAMIEIPLLAHVRLVSDQSNVFSLNLIVGYGYGITSGRYEEIMYDNETRTSGELIEHEVANLIS
ncbi:MAG: hypothetical protein ACJAQ4_001961 [Cryomorphaceae bacterium]|jgi:hypothetical protein